MYLANPMALCGCGFSINLTFVLLKFCEPFNPDLKNKTILKVDSRYCSVKSSANSITNPNTPLHAVGYVNEEKVVGKPDNSMFVYCLSNYFVLRL